MPVVAVVVEVAGGVAAVAETKRLTLQWHITARCNQRCRHCYQETYQGPELSLPEIMQVVAQYRELLESLNTGQDKAFRDKAFGHVNITGGEPLYREDFWDILDLFSRQRPFLSFGLLTNGSLITTESADRLRKLGVSFVQVSVEGDQATHDMIRGPGNFKRTLAAIRTLRKAGLYTMVSFTSHRDNFETFPAVARAVRRCRADKLWTDRLVPIGHGRDLTSGTLTPREAMSFFATVRREQAKGMRNKLAGLEISLERALQFLHGGSMYRCQAGDTLLTILENGDVLPCRRLPLVAGNVLSKSLSQIYYDNSVFRNLRQERIPLAGCRTCPYFIHCGGGARCLSYAVSGDPFLPDQGCPIARIPF